jgi:predicted ATPase/transcriptional regulator with XRE-family HTH domain
VASVEHVPFGTLLRRFRLASGLTQASLAGRAGLSERAVNDLERDLKRLPRLETVTLLAAALDLLPEQRAQLLAAARPETPVETLQPGTSQAAPARVFPPSSPPIGSRLPAAPSAFIGRVREVAAVQERLKRPGMRLLTLTGPGGIGKTRLALQVATLLEGAYADGVAFVPLASLVDPALVLPSIAAELGIPDSATESTGQRIAEALRSRELLLVLDNFEQVMPAAVEIEHLLAACPRLTILVTSRAVLHLAREHEYRVPPLAVPDPTAIAAHSALLEYDSVALLVQCAQAVVPEFMVSEANAQPVAAICARLEGVPLAIQLAAARIKLLPAATLLARLDQQLAVLTGGPQDAPERQRTVRATLDWSFHLLNSPQQTLLRRLAVFAGGWTLEAAEGICAGDNVERVDVLDLLGYLVDQSLVIAEDHGGVARYRMLETIRQFADEKLRESGEEQALRDRHLAWFLRMAEDVESQTWLLARQGSHAALKPEADNFRAALAWSRRDESGQTELLLAGLLISLWTGDEMINEGQRVLRDALDRADPTARTLARARALLLAAGLAGIQTNSIDAAQVSQEALSILRELGEEQYLAGALIHVARTWFWAGSPMDLSAMRDESLRLCRKLGDRIAYAETLWMWGDLALDQGNYADARRQLEESIAVCRQLNDPFMLGYPLLSLARVASAEGDFTQARALAQESVALRQEAPAWLLAISCTSLGEVERCAGDDERAAELFAQALAIFHDQSDAPGAAWTIHNLGHIALRVGERQRAAQLFAEALAARFRHGYSNGIASGLAAFGSVACQSGDYERAAQLFGATEAILENRRCALAPADVPVYQRDVAMLRTQMETPAFAVAWAAGRALPVEQAVAEALKTMA